MTLPSAVWFTCSVLVLLFAFFIVDAKIHVILQFLLQMNDNDDPHSQKPRRESPSRQVVHPPMQRSNTVRELSPTESRPPLSPTLSRYGIWLTWNVLFFQVVLVN